MRTSPSCQIFKKIFSRHVDITTILKGKRKTLKKLLSKKVSLHKKNSKKKLSHRDQPACATWRSWLATILAPLNGFNELVSEFANQGCIPPIELDYIRKYRTANLVTKDDGSYSNCQLHSASLLNVILYSSVLSTNTKLNRKLGELCELY